MVDCAGDSGVYLESEQHEEGDGQLRHNGDSLSQGGRRGKERTQQNSGENHPSKSGRVGVKQIPHA